MHCELNSSRIIGFYISKFKNILNNKPQLFSSEIKVNAGLFPLNKSQIHSFYLYCLNTLPKVDILASWLLSENILYAHNTPKYITELVNIDVPTVLKRQPGTIPWTSHLHKKNVLVIHPFEDSIRYQYENNRINLASETCATLPEFNLLTLKPPLTNGFSLDPRFRTWSEALIYIYKKTCELNYDIAILGCGAYSFPLLGC